MVEGFVKGIMGVFGHGDTADGVADEGGRWTSKRAAKRAAKKEKKKQRAIQHHN